MTDLTKPQSQLKNLLENAARYGETACVSASLLKEAEAIASERHLKVELYVIPATNKKPQPV